MIGKIELKALADLFDYPCNMCSPEETMHEEEQDIEWCEKNCGKATADQCWHKYFEIIRRNNNGKDS